MSAPSLIDMFVWPPAGCCTNTTSKNTSTMHPSTQGLWEPCGPCWLASCQPHADQVHHYVVTRDDSHRNVITSLHSASPVGLQCSHGDRMAHRQVGGGNAACVKTTSKCQILHRLHARLRKCTTSPVFFLQPLRSPQVVRRQQGCVLHE